MRQSSEPQKVEVSPVVHYHVPGPECGQESYDITQYVERAKRKESQPASFAYDLKTNKVLVGTIEFTDQGLQFDLRWEDRISEYGPGLAVLSLRLKDDSPLYFLVKDDTLDSSATPEELFQRKQYLYETHICPTNWLRHVLEIYHDGRADPHGMFTLEHVFTAEEVFEKTRLIPYEYNNKRNFAAKTDSEDTRNQFLYRLAPGLMSVR